MFCLRMIKSVLSHHLTFQPLFLPSPRWPLVAAGAMPSGHAGSGGPGARRAGVAGAGGGGREPPDPAAAQPIAGHRRPAPGG